MEETELNRRFSSGVYIYAPDKQLTHFSGCLVEGLLALGIGIKTNAVKVTSRPASMPLVGIDLTSLQSDPVSGFDAYLVDISTDNAFLPLDGVASAPVGYITTSDISAFCAVPEEYILFAAHNSTHAVKPGRRIPIAFGLPTQLIETTEQRPAFSDREQTALHSFRSTLQQGVRALMELAFVPGLNDVLTVKRVNVPPGQYVRQLMSAAVCLAYGGDFYSPIVGNTWFEKISRNSTNSITLRTSNLRLCSAGTAGGFGKQWPQGVSPFISISTIAGFIFQSCPRPGSIMFRSTCRT